jgi:diphosphomevalonate decarboxylase
MTGATARANANVALAKYWGKRDDLLNLPFTGSISVTLAGLHSTASVLFRGAAHDRICANGEVLEGHEADRISRFLDLIRQRGGHREHADVVIETNFPVAAGIASSASTFAALALAASAASGLSLTEKELSLLARRGSGSAARSIHGGYVEWLPGEARDGADSYAVQLAPPRHWPLGIVVVITDELPKKTGSREGMMRAVRESPFFPAWLESHEADLAVIRDGILQCDLSRVGRAGEHNCLKMHAVCFGSRPALIYWNAATLAVIRRVNELREDGLHAYFTIDAGPQVKVICPMEERAAVADALGAVPGVCRVLPSEVGGGAQLLERPRAAEQVA